MPVHLSWREFRKSFYYSYGFSIKCRMNTAQNSYISNLTAFGNNEL